MMRASVDERFWAKVERWDPADCWWWTGSLAREGYGCIGNGGRSMYIHRWAYERFVGPIPEGLVIDHLCENRACVNPGHMEPVTRGENVLRGSGILAEKARQTRCVHGHPLSGANVMRTRRNPRARHCRECKRQRDRVYHARKVHAA